MASRVLIEGLGSPFLISRASKLNQIQLVFNILNWTECLDRLWDNIAYINSNNIIYLEYYKTVVKGYINNIIYHLVLTNTAILRLYMLALVNSR